MITFARASLAALLMLSMAGSSAFAADAPPVKIGMITTLSTAGGYLGEDMRDGFQLAIDEEHGKLGGVPVQVVVEDDGLKPANGKQIADKFLLQDKIQLFTGIIYSNVALAVVPSVVEAGAFYVSPNSGPSQLAGKGCRVTVVPARTSASPYQACRSPRSEYSRSRTAARVRSRDRAHRTSGRSYRGIRTA